MTGLDKTTPSPGQPAELLAAVGQLLGNEERSPNSTDIRIAARLVKIVARDLVEGPIAAASERERLQRLLRNETADTDTLRLLLCQHIAENSVDALTPELRDHLWATTRDRLRIDQPRYSSGD